MSKTVAIVLSGGSGKRMKMDIPKQYMEIHGHPLIYYTLAAFEKSSVDEIVFVTAAGEEEYCKKEIVDKYQFQKVKQIVAGGKERYDSVYNGIKSTSAEYVLVHDGARACVSKEVIEEAIKNVKLYKSAVAAVPVKDTIKMADKDGIVINTPPRDALWQVQTPQAFLYCELKDAYEKMYSLNQCEGITDDAMVMEKFGNAKVKLYLADYNNIKVTTPEDVTIVEKILL